MNIPNPNIRPDAGQKPPQIQQLSPTVINRIAAGEVVERPASAVKELVENALDAGATRVQIDYAQGGKSLIRVSDNGHGMGAEDLPLALARHATSKTTGEDLLQIHSFGFRGEALASLAAVARMTLTSRPEGAEAAMLSVDGGEMQPVRPAAANPGTTIELRDLFYATPARLKFLRTDRAEAQAIADTVRRISMAQPWVAFRLRDLTPDPARSVLDLTPETGDMFDALPARLSRLLGPDFAANALRLDAEREGVRLTGLAALPTYARASSTAQYFFVNGRPVKDKLLLGALRAAYMDVLPSGRYPAAALFLDCAPELVDVNVHPAKSEVRFRSPGEVRGLVVGALRHRLAEAGHRSSSTLGPAALGAARPETSEPRIYQSQPRPSFGARQAAYAAQAPMAPSPEAPATESFAGFAEPSARIYPAEATEPTASLAEPNAPASDLTPDLTQAPLGAARAQLHGCYIVTQT
ncbi:MAG: DNA mismatch repair endonuclease MutL, partial [Mangrovicoccus sp.]